MLLRFEEIFNLHDLIPQSICELNRIDMQKGSCLTKSLFCYVSHHQDITSTANALHIHYNTLKYRIGRIIEITGIDLNDPEVVFQVMLAERVFDLLGNLTPPPPV
jgi:DNA-binding PucR family transcriptional regulator